MYWQEAEDKQAFVVPSDIQDLSFRTQGKCLPLDHAHSLSSAIRAVLPWLTDEPGSGIHLIHVAESGNGWFRPEDPSRELLHLSRRTRLTLRVPEHRVEDAKTLSGKTLHIDGHDLTVGEASNKLLSPLTTVFSRYVVDQSEGDETAFVEQVVRQLGELDIHVRKLLCGRPHAFQLPDKPLPVRSVLLADLKQTESVLLQQHGLGPHRLLGCGLFLPHKGVAPVAADKDD
ncbi:MAG: type I-MYXAN CRISPR-associated protein Cas6/Cmx6 [Saprospiraceae bacterium]|nr:type I-MYXAN CRISPR-associated protein Cas6/Cmx6 [Saprospiraceae bacterium]